MTDGGGGCDTGFAIRGGVEVGALCFSFDTQRVYLRGMGALWIGRGFTNGESLLVEVAKRVCAGLRAHVSEGIAWHLWERDGGRGPVAECLTHNIMLQAVQAW